MLLCRDKNWRKEVLCVQHIVPEVMEGARKVVLSSQNLKPIVLS